MPREIRTFSTNGTAKIVKSFIARCDKSHEFVSCPLQRRFLGACRTTLEILHTHEKVSLPRCIRLLRFDGVCPIYGSSCRKEGQDGANVRQRRQQNFLFQGRESVATSLSLTVHAPASLLAHLPQPTAKLRALAARTRQPLVHAAASLQEPLLLLTASQVLVRSQPRADVAPRVPPQIRMTRKSPRKGQQDFWSLRKQLISSLRLRPSRKGLHWQPLFGPDLGLL